jgi:hypothetical protein
MQAKAIMDSAEESLREQFKSKWRSEHSVTTQQFAESLSRGMNAAVAEMQVRFAIFRFRASMRVSAGLALIG